MAGRWRRSDPGGWRVPERANRPFKGAGNSRENPLRVVDEKNRIVRAGYPLFLF
jgi:hypothetical protein